MPQRLNNSDEIGFGPFRLIASERLLLNGTTPVPLGGRALDILIALIERAGEVVTHQELFKRVWSDVIVEGTSLRVHIAGLRKALGDGRNGARYITNVPAKGYCFVATLQRSGRSRRSAAEPPERSAAATLPRRPLGMVGRDETIERLQTEVIAKRFISIVGPGGVGKTTTAVAVAHALESEFPGAACFVDLSAIRDETLLVTAVASAVGCLDHAQGSQEGLLAFLSDKRFLLILDSCEHVLEPVAYLAERLFREALRVHIVATTREALRVEGENILQLSSLDTPAKDVMLTSADALAYPAVRLFVDRAAAGGHRHELTDEDGRVVADICRHLDGVATCNRIGSQPGEYLRHSRTGGCDWSSSDACLAIARQRAAASNTSFNARLELRSSVGSRKVDVMRAVCFCWNIHAGDGASSCARCRPGRIPSSRGDRKPD